MEPLLSAADRAKLDSGADAAFYDQPRFVTHADDGFLDRLTGVYGSVLDDGDRVLDAASSWVSHLPDREYGRVVGHGLNEAELAANDALDEWVLQDLSADRALPFDGDAFAAVL